MPLSTLNQEQYTSATCNLGHNLIIASAGTGKTSTIVGRIAHLLNVGIKPKEILLLTFTNKASNEMIQRVAKYFGKDIASNIISGTFHSVSYKLLQSLDTNIVLKQPNELKTLFKALYEKRVFYNIIDTTPYDGGYLYDLYSLYLNSSYEESFEEWIYERNKDHKDFIQIYLSVVDEFNQIKQEYSYANFDDLLTTMLSALDNHKFNFVEILVDEYQDTNPLQGKLLDRFNPRSLFCVGDYDQSIYAFNGSDIGIISSFETRYEDAKIYTLTKNYRSSKPILDLANIVISNNDRIYPKSLEVIRKDISIPPKLLGFEELFDQYKYVAQNISKSDTNHEDIAVIFRNNSSADGIELFLRDLDIPSKRKGGHSFFDLKEVRVVLDIITLLIKPNDMMSFIHIVEYGKGIGKSLAKDIFDALMVLGDKDVLQGLIHPKDILNPYQKKIKVYEVGLFDDDIELGSASRFVKSGFDDNFMGNPILKNTKISIEGGEFLFKLYMLLKLLRRFKNTKAIIEVISQSELFISIKEILSTKRATNKAGEIDSKYKEVIKTNIDKKIVMMQDIAKQYKDVNKFLNAMVLAGGELSTSKGVNLLSIHASKGLEFKEVYIIDLMQNRFPNTKLISKGGSLEEERRLFYVAVTRAKDILYLSYAKYDKIKKQTFLPSRFLKEARMVT